MIFATYSSLIGESQNSGKYSTRLSQLLRWCGSDFDGVVSFSMSNGTLQCYETVVMSAGQYDLIYHDKCSSYLLA